MGIGQDLLNVPMGDMIRQMAFAIADAQWALDESSMRVAEMMSGKRILRDAKGKLIEDEDGAPIYEDTRVYFGRRKLTSTDSPATISYEPEKLSMLELGFTPNFYQFIDTLIEVKIAIKMSYESSYSSTTKGTRTDIRASYNASGYSYSVTTTPVDATYSSKYSYSAEGSSLLRTKLVPVPPPPVLEERIRRMLDQELEDRED